MKFLTILAFSFLISSCAKQQHKSLCLDNEKITSYSNINITNSAVIFLNGNIYINSQTGATYYRVLGLSDNARQVVDQIQLTAKQRGLDRYRSRGDIAGKVITCGPKGDQRIYIWKMALSDPVAFTADDFSRMLNEQRKGKALEIGRAAPRRDGEDESR